MLRPSRRVLMCMLGAAALILAFFAGLKTIAEFDLGWQMATARWVVQHGQIPTTEVLSYTAAGTPWTYPIGSGLIFYGIYLLGGYSLLSWLGAAVCVLTVLVTLRRGTPVTAGLAIIAVPLIAARTNVRAELFTVVLFALMLSILWEDHKTGNARLWLLPLIMIAWVNLHPGFIAGFALLGAYLLLEAVDLVRPARRRRAKLHLRRAWPWFAAASVATLLNPLGWGVYEVVTRQESVMQTHSQLISEWAPISVNWNHLVNGLNPVRPEPFYVLFVIAIVAIGFAIYTKRFGEAMVLAAAVYMPLRHTRFIALFAVVVVIVGGAILTDLFELVRSRLSDRRVSHFAVAAGVIALVAVATNRSVNFATDRAYRNGADLVSFGTGLSWWFPERAAAFVERENLPGEIFSTGSEGGFIAFRLGPKYKDYIDGRAIPFGTDLMVRSGRLTGSAPDSPEWQEEVKRYGISTILLPIGRFSALQFFPAFQQFCESDAWRPVYLDEVSVVFLRRAPETENLIQKLQIDCATTPIPAVTPHGNGTEAYNTWANAAAVLNALGRGQEAQTALSKALAIYPDNGYLHFMRGHMLQNAGNPIAAESEFLRATELEPNLVAPWSALAGYYEKRKRYQDAVRAWEHAAAVSNSPWEPLVSLGFADLQLHRPAEALKAFDAAADSLPQNSDLPVNNAFRANIAYGRGRSYYHLGNLQNAIKYEEEAANLLPNVELWYQLAALYDQAGRHEEAVRLRNNTMALARRQAGVAVNARVQ